MIENITSFLLFNSFSSNGSRFFSNILYDHKELFLVPKDVILLNKRITYWSKFDFKIQINCFVFTYSINSTNIYTYMFTTLLWLNTNTQYLLFASQQWAHENSSINGWHCVIVLNLSPTINVWNNVIFYKIFPNYTFLLQRPMTSKFYLWLMKV